MAGDKRKGKKDNVLPEVTVTASAPRWLNYDRQFEKEYPKEKFIEDYLNPLAKSLGNTADNYPARLDADYISKKQDYVAEKLLKEVGFKTKSREDRIRLYDSFSDKERRIIKDSSHANKFLPAERENSIRTSDSVKTRFISKYGIPTPDLTDLDKAVEGTPERGRFLANFRSPIEDYVNPAIWVGHMAKDLGKAIHSGEGKEIAKAVAAPLAAGALGFNPAGSILKGGVALKKGAAKVEEAAMDITRSIQMGYEETAAARQAAKTVKPVSKTLPKNEFRQLRQIQSLQSMLKEDSIDEVTTLTRFLKSSLDDNAIKKITGKTRQELQEQLETASATPVKKASPEMYEGPITELSPEETAILERHAAFTQGTQGRGESNLDAVIGSRSTPRGEGYDRLMASIANRPARRRSSMSVQEFNNLGQEQYADIFNGFIVNNTKNYKDSPFFKLGEKVGNKVASLTANSELVPFKGHVNHGPDTQYVLSHLFKGEEVQGKEVLEKVNTAFNRVAEGDKGIYAAASSMSDNSAPLYYKKAAALSGKKNIDFQVDGFQRLNNHGFLAKTGVDQQTLVDFINTHTKDLSFNGKKLPAAYIDKDINDVMIPNLFIKKFAKGGYVGGDPDPIYVTDPKHPRLIAYQDSVAAYKNDAGWNNALLNLYKSNLSDMEVGKQHSAIDREYGMRLINIGARTPVDLVHVPQRSYTRSAPSNMTLGISQVIVPPKQKVILKTPPPPPPRDKRVTQPIDGVPIQSFKELKRDLRKPNVDKHNVLNETFVPVTRSGSYLPDDQAGVVRYENVNKTKSYSKQDYEKLKQGQVPRMADGGYMWDLLTGKPQKELFGNLKQEYADRQKSMVPTNTLPMAPNPGPHGDMFRDALDAQNQLKQYTPTQINAARDHKQEIAEIPPSSATYNLPQWNKKPKDMFLTNWGGAASALGSMGTVAANTGRPDVIMGMGSGALKGAGYGAALGPMGAAIGAIGGAVVGLASTGINRGNYEEARTNMEKGKLKAATIYGGDPGIRAEGGNVGGEEGELTPIQTEKGENIVLPDGHIFRSKAKLFHKQMPKDEITDILPPEAYVASSAKRMSLDRNKADKMVLGLENITYSEEGNSSVPKEITLGDYFNKKKMTPAEILDSVKNKFPSNDLKFDPFARRANQLNLQSRLPIINAVIAATQMK